MKNLKKFPEEVFPKEIRDEINLISENEEPRKIMAYSALLSFLGLGFSIPYKIYILKAWEERSNLFMITLANSGTGKTGINNIFMGPVKDYIKTELKPNYKKRKEIYDEYIRRKGKLEKSIEKLNKQGEIITLDNLPEEIENEYNAIMNWGKNNGIRFNDEKDTNIIFPSVKKPELYTLITNKGTIQGRDNIFDNNAGRSVMIFRDEIKAFFSNMNAFGKGSDVEDFLEYFDYGSSNTSNASEETSRSYDEKTVTFYGSSQRNVLLELFSTGDFIDNGLLWRILVCDATSEEFPEYSYDNDVGIIRYELIMNKLLEKYNTNHSDDIFTRVEIKPTQDCLDFVKSWYDEMKTRYENGDEFSSVNKEIFISIIGKFNRYIHRFALILGGTRKYNEAIYENNGKLEMDMMAGEIKSSDITVEDYKNASILCSFFIDNIIKLYLDICLLSKKPSAMREIDYNFLYKLPSETSRRDFVGKAIKHYNFGGEHPRKQVDRLLRERLYPNNVIKIINGKFQKTGV